MAENPTSSKSAKPAETRENRLKAALKANLARRKAQARARQDQAAANKTGKNEE